MRDKVSQLLNQIRRRGDPALVALLRRWDGVRLAPSQWRVPLEKARRALKSLSSGKRSALKDAAGQIRRFHETEKGRFASSWQRRKDGLVVGQKWSPVDSVGAYVPGGRFAYPSTVLMTVIPARVAGVRRIALATPPKHLTDEVLAAAVLAGVDEIYQLGGIAAVGALAIGTRTVPKVDLIVGPGGAWVTEAKRQVFGDVGIDLLAGPSEIVLLADRSVPPVFVAADMMAQAEHDPLARATLISPDRKVLSSVKEAVEKRFAKQCRFLPARDWTHAIEQANGLAGEHLSLMVRRPEKLLSKVRNAGAIFLGAWSPVAAGDYWAGPSHVLPTGRSARFSSGLSVLTFLKRSSVIQLSKSLLRRKANTIASLAEAEGLVYHAASIRRRGLEN